jgi:lipopolysaccharide/colanic/teichoic acid biosynthesis glycosyltransferase
MPKIVKIGTAELAFPSSRTSVIDSLTEKLVRAMEIVVATGVLIATSPIMAIIWLAIKLDSPGPAIFKQTRVGKNYRNGHPGNNHGSNRRTRDLGGKPFTFYKFRTMHVDAKCRYPEFYRYDYSTEEIQNMHFKLKDDPRLTRLGRHLRKTTLDELPNFINLLKGDIALVGPRPDIPQMVRYYQEGQKKKLAVKPGITGLSQVSGRGILSFQETLELDVAYVENKSPWLDLKIILKTFWVSIHRLGAF